MKIYKQALLLSHSSLLEIWLINVGACLGTWAPPHTQKIKRKKMQENMLQTCSTCLPYAHEWEDNVIKLTALGIHPEKNVG